MKTRGLQRSERGRQRGLDHRGVRTDKSPPVAGEYAYPESAQCVGCGAVYLRKTWRRSAPRRLGAYLLGAERVSCPACRQVGEGRGYGRVLLQGAGLADREDEVRRRIAAVESRARFSQPERRLVEIIRRGESLEVVTTSQKLAHRVARELEKAFGGETSYAWSDRDGSLRATWSLPRLANTRIARPPGSAARPASRPR